MSNSEQGLNMSSIQMIKDLQHQQMLDREQAVVKRFKQRLAGKVKPLPSEHEKVLRNNLDNLYDE